MRTGKTYNFYFSPHPTLIQCNGNIKRVVMIVNPAGPMSSFSLLYVFQYSQIVVLELFLETLEFCNSVRNWKTPRVPKFIVGNSSFELPCGSIWIKLWYSCRFSSTCSSWLSAWFGAFFNFSRLAAATTIDFWFMPWSSWLFKRFFLLYLYFYWILYKLSLGVLILRLKSFVGRIKMQRTLKCRSQHDTP